VKKVFIYSLTDPNTGLIRYIGKTTNLRTRFRGHLYEARNRVRNPHKCNWLINLLKEGKLPIMEVVEETDSDNWMNIEAYWIEQFTVWGFNLVNKTESFGQGRISKEAKDALAKSNRGQKKGFKHSEETKALIREKRALQVMTEEHKKRISEACKGKIVSEETKLKMSIASKGKPKSEEHINNIRRCRTKN
jgi:hypothetical protein